MGYQPTSLPASAGLALPPERLAYLMQFTHPEKVLARLPGWTDATLAAAWGVSQETLMDIRASFARAAESAARELLAEPEFAVQLARLPLPPGGKLVALGDSYTDDWQSWLEILRHALRLARPQGGITVVNAGMSGDTTAQAVSRFLAVVREKPDCVVCMLGTNDARLHGEPARQTMASLAETQRNLDLLYRLCQAQAPSRWLWTTPARVIESRIREHWFLAPAQVSFRNSDLDGIAAVVRERLEPVLDLQRLFGETPDPHWLLDDGLHPSITGHQAIARAVVRRLSADR